MLTLLDGAIVTIGLGFTFIVGRQLMTAIILCIIAYVLIKSFVPSHAKSTLFNRFTRSNGGYAMEANQRPNRNFDAIDYRE